MSSCLWGSSHAQKCGWGNGGAVLPPNFEVPYGGIGAWTHGLHMLGLGPWTVFGLWTNSSAHGLMGPKGWAAVGTMCIALHPPTQPQFHPTLPSLHARV